MQLDRKSLAQCQKLDKISVEARQKYLEGKLKSLVAFAYKNAPAIKERFDRVKINPSGVKSIRDLESLPILHKDDLVDLQKANPPFGGLVTVPVTKLERVYVSPGPIFDPYHLSNTYWARHVHIFQSMGFREGDIAVNTWAYHLVPAGLMIDESLRMAGVTVLPMGVGNTDLQVQVMQALKATTFLGTTGFFMNIITRAEEMGLDIRKDFNLRLAQIGGEMGGGPVRQMVEEKYGIKTRDLYGTADLGFVANECEKRDGMHIGGEIIVEIVNPETGKPVNAGEAGEVVLTPIDEIYPLIRFGTGDLATLTNEPCACGRTSPRLSRILGRVGDAVRIRGMFVHPRQIEPVLSKYQQISKYQIVVTRTGQRDDMTLNVELKEGQADTKALAEELVKVVTDAARIKLDHCEFVAKGTIAEGQKILLDKRVF